MIKVPISVGELLDKITILQIKAEKTDNSYVHKELKDLLEIAKELKVLDQEYLIQLKEVNSKLWIIEDQLRDLEKIRKFDMNFIELARSVYITNDLRASIKKEINIKYNSTYQEVKLYSNK
jgi:hypothetical protein